MTFHERKFSLHCNLASNEKYAFFTSEDINKSVKGMALEDNEHTFKTENSQSRPD